jgi:hypothetical protein
MASSDASEMRGFVYLSKNNREHHGLIGFRHPNHPRPNGVVLRCAEDAWRFTADVLVKGKMWEQALAHLKRTAAHPALVPIPASCTTSDNIDGRWAARGIASAIAAQGIGRIVLAVVNKQATVPTRGQHVPPSVLGKNLAWYDGDIKPWETVVYVDDVLTWGYHIVAVDRFMGGPKNALGITVAATDGVTRKKAIKARIRGIHAGPGVDDVSVDNVAEAD